MGAKAWGEGGERLRTGWLAHRSGVEWSGDEMRLTWEAEQSEAKRSEELYTYLPTYLPTPLVKTHISQLHFDSSPPAVQGAPRRCLHQS